MKTLQKLLIFFGGGGDRKVREYLSNLPTLKNDPLSIQAMLELAGLKMKENCQIEELTLGEKKILFLIKLVADTSKQYIFQSLFQDGRGHISRSKIKDMCIMPPFVMRDILKVIRASETAEAVIPLWEVIPGEYEEYAHQVLNSNAGKKGFSYRYISHRPFRSGDIYWIMEHQLQELKVDGRPCFEKVSLMTDEATIHVTCSEYFFWCCKELETIFYHYSENHVEEL